MHTQPELLAAYRAGTSDAFDTIYREYYEPLRRFLQSGFTFVSRGRTCRMQGGMVGMDIDSLVQEAFLRAFSETARRNYDGLRPFKNYLFTVARNLALREAGRKEKVLSFDLQTDVSTYLEKQNSVAVFSANAYAPSPEKSAQNQQLTAITELFIRGLDQEEREFFTIRFAEESTQQATAQRMGVTRSRVKLLEKKLRQRFLVCLREHGYFEGYNPQPRWQRAGKVERKVA